MGQTWKKKKTLIHEYTVHLQEPGTGSEHGPYLTVHDSLQAWLGAVRERIKVSCYIKIHYINTFFIDNTKKLGWIKTKCSCQKRRIAVLWLNKSPVDDSLFDLLYVHGTSGFLQDNLRTQTSSFKETNSCEPAVKAADGTETQIYWSVVMNRSIIPELHRATSGLVSLPFHWVVHCKDRKRNISNEPSKTTQTHRHCFKTILADCISLW